MELALEVALGIIIAYLVINFVPALLGLAYDLYQEHRSGVLWTIAAFVVLLLLYSYQSTPAK